MPISIISDIQPDGQPFYSNGAKCDLFPFFVTFADGVSGQANSKSQTPPYRVGESKEYTITGNYQGTNKLKIGNPGQGAPPARSAAPNPVARSDSRPSNFVRGPQGQDGQTSQVAPINGASVGMAMNQALGLLTRDLKRDEVVARVCDPLFWEAVMETASDVLRVSRHLESGHLSPSVRERGAGYSKAAEPFRAPVRTNTAAGANRPTERQLSNQTDESDFDQQAADASGLPF